jgi:ribosomal protein L37AE/L43A
MGSMFIGECPCGFKSRDLNIGCGMIIRADLMPVACPGCHALRVEDSKSGRRTCRRCKAALYYLHEAGSFTPADVLTRFKASAPWDIYAEEGKDRKSIPEVRYRCPKCGRMEMSLIFVGEWD